MREIHMKSTTENHQKIMDEGKNINYYYKLWQLKNKIKKENNLKNI